MKIDRSKFNNLPPELLAALAKAGAVKLPETFAAPRVSADAAKLGVSLIEAGTVRETGSKAGEAYKSACLRISGDNGATLLVLPVGSATMLDRARRISAALAAYFA